MMIPLILPMLLIPDWGYTCHIPRSTTAPLSETEYGAMAYNRWQHLSVRNEFMIKSNITHWIKCTPTTQGASLATLTAGTFTCDKIKLVATACVSPTNYPNVILSTTTTFPGLFLTSAGVGHHLYYWDCETTTCCWPAHDSCGQTQQNQLTGVSDPYAAIYLR